MKRRGKIVPKYAKWLKKMRIQRGFTQDFIADHVHVARETVSKWERAKARPSNEIVQKLFDLYNCSEAEKLSYIDPPK